MNNDRDCPADPLADKQPVVAQSGGPLCGTVRVPGDKSISHRALILGALAEGETRATNLLEAEDVLATAGALRALGVPLERTGEGEWTVSGGGLGAIAEPETVIDCGNSGTTARLLSGLIAANPVTATLTGDASLCARPMARVFEPMREIGAEIRGRAGDRLPAIIHGTRRPLPVDWELPVASAQVKSAILLVALHGRAETRLIEPEPTRDHTERMLRRMGAHIESCPLPTGGIEHRIRGGEALAPLEVAIPADPSAAALVAAAALVVEGSEVLLEGVCVNATRIGFFETLAEMGARIDHRNPRESGGEPVADIAIRHGPLRGVRVPAERAPRMIDEYPALAVVAAFAEGETRMEGVADLRAKESDRIATTAAGLARCGVRVATDSDTLSVRGTGRPTGGATVAVQGDHRIAMAFLALGLGAKSPVAIDDIRPARTSFPDYVALMQGLGANLG